MQRGIWWLIAIGMGLVVPATTGHAQVSTWVGPESGEWFEPANWSPAIPNASGATALFDSQDPVVFGQVAVTQDVTLGKLMLEGNQVLQILGPAVLNWSDATTGLIHLPDPGALLLLDANLRTTGNFPLAIDTADNASVQLSGDRLLASSPLTKRGSGVLQLGGSSAGWTGPLLIEQGTVVVDHPARLGPGPASPSSGTRVDPGGRLELSGSFTTTAEHLQLAGGELFQSQGNATFGGPVQLLADSRIAAELGARLTILGAITGDAGLTFQGNELALTAVDGRNTYTGLTTVDAGTTLRIRSSQSLGSNNTTPADGTLVRGGSRLVVNAGGNLRNEWLSLEDSTLEFAGTGEGQLDTTIELRGMNRLRSSRNEQWISGHWTGSGGITIDSIPHHVHLSQTGDYSGPTYLEGTTAIVEHPTAFGSPIGATYLRNAGVIMRSSEPSREPLHAGANSSIDLSSSEHQGAITLEQGTLWASALFGPARLNAPLHVVGSGTLDNDGATLVLSQGIQGEGVLWVRGSRPVELRGELSPDIVLDVSTTLHFSEPQHVTQPIRLSGGQLHADESVHLDQLQVVGDRGSLTSSSTATITLGGEFDPKQMSVDANLAYDRPIVIEDRWGPEFRNLGPEFHQDILIREGRLIVAGDQGLGSSTGVTRIEPGSHGVLQIRSGVTLTETLELNNSRGWANSGAIIVDQFPFDPLGSEPTILRGRIDLGDEGASIAFIRRWPGRLHLEGAVSGRDLLLLGGGEVVVGSESVAHTGTTIVRRGRLTLADRGQLKQTSAIVVGKFAEFVLDNEERIELDRVGDTIPIRLEGGLLQLQSHRDQSAIERLGPVHLAAGDSQISTGGSFPSELTIQSLSRERGTTVELEGHNRSLKIAEPPALVRDILGGWARFRFGFATLSGTEVTAVEQRGVPLSLASNGDHLFLRESGALTSDLELSSLASPNQVDVDLNQRTLTIATGGLVLTGGSTIHNGKLTAGISGPAELFVHGRSRISADIVDHLNGPVSLVISGDYVELSGTNSYSGTTTVNDLSTLGVSNTAALPSGTDLRLDGGTLRVEGVIPLQLGEVILRDDAALEARESTVRAEHWQVESGYIQALLSGDAPLDKTSQGTLRIFESMPGYSGIIDVREGVLLLSAPRAGGTNQVRVGPDGIVAASGAMDTDILLQGGSLWGTSFDNPARYRNVTVESDSQIVLFDARDPLSMAGAPITILGGLCGAGNLLVEGPSGLTLAGNGSNYTGNIRLKNAELVVLHPRAIAGATTQVLSGAQLSLDSSQPVSGHVELVEGTLSSLRQPRGTFAGQLRVAETGYLSGASLTLSGDVSLADNARLVRMSESELIVNGTLHVGRQTTLQSDQARVNLSGVIVPADADSRLDFVSSDTGQLNLTGTLDLPAGRRLELTRNGQPAAIELTAATSVLQGSGTLGGDVLLSATATVSPGPPTGTLTIDGTLTLAGGIYAWDVESIVPAAGDATRADMIQVTGAVRVADDAAGPTTVRVQPRGGTEPQPMVEGFDPLQDTEWPILSAANLTNLTNSDFQVDAAALHAVYPLARHGSFQITLRDNQVLLGYFADPSVGDFNGNGVYDASDIDALMAQIRTGVWAERFDLDLDQQVDFQDAVVWVDQVARTFFGDANLDGQFSSSDLVNVFEFGHYEDALVANSTWESGDWNGDQEFNSSDLVLAFQGGGYEQGPRTAAAVVPEPTGVMIVLVGAATLASVVRRQRRNPHVLGTRR